MLYHKAIIEISDSERCKEKELQEEMQQHEQRMFDLQCQNYDFDYGDVKY